MRLVVALEYRFLRADDGSHYAHKHYHFDFWRRYLVEFQEVVVCARARQTREAPPGWRRVEGPGVSFADLDDYSGPVDFLRRLPSLYRQARAVLERVDCAVLRVPGLVSSVLAWELRRRSHRYAVEVVGDPWEAIGAAVPGLRGKIFAGLVAAATKRQCRRAVAAAYVTRSTLQKRYPPRRDAWVTHYSSVELPEDAYATAPREYGQRAEAVRRGEHRWSLVFIGSLEQRYKGLDVLLRALARVDARTTPWRLSILGEGRLLEEHRELARRLALLEHVDFLGQVPSGRAVWDVLASADLMLQPSRTEGLPRALIEAMASALPCLGTPVGGIPELLPDSDLVSVDDVDALARSIGEVLEQPRRLEEMSKRNLSLAREYSSEILRQRRSDFYANLRKRAERSEVMG